ncbi:MAG: Hpt domain-containing protein, partial [Proteobacteria bacterium]|nr:Hpt domain-containing protein [Pseudomonadota bacterium]
EEILEIFSEEVDEVLENLQLHFPVWAENQDSSALAEIRRGFHTLKGSGRMVNASQIAELAWSIESMLNRLIDGTISFSSELKELIESVILVIPTLISAFNNRLLVDDPRIENWSLNAERLSKGEPVIALPSEIEPVSSPADEIESIPDQPQELTIESTASESPLSAVPTLFEIFSEECRQHLRELNQSIAQGMSDTNIEIVSRALHTIRGSANAVGAFGIAQIAGALEPFFYTANSLPVDLGQRLSMLTGDSTLLIEQLVEQPSAHFEEEISGALLQLEELHESIRAHDQADTAPDQATDAEPLLSDTVAEATGQLLIHGMDCLSYNNESLERWHLSGIETAQQLKLIDQCERLVLLSQDASVPEAIEITTLLQQIFQQLKPEITLAESTYQQLITAQDTLFRVLDSVAMGQRISPVDSVTEQLNELLNTLQTASTDADQITIPEQIDSDITTQITADEIDPETLEIFSEEARELCQSIEQAISSWLIESRNELYPEELLRHLHTLKGGARVTGLDNFGSFAHEFESFLTSITPVHDEFDDRIKIELLSQLEQLIERVDNLSSGVDTRDLQLAPSAAFEIGTAENTENIPVVLEEGDTTENVLPIAVTQEPLTRPHEPKELIDKINPGASTVSPDIPAIKAPKTFSRVSTDLLESLVNLAGESSISRARTEQQVGALGNTLDEMQITLERLRNQIRQVDIETQAQSLRQKSEITEAEHEGFDALEMDRYSGMQQLARSLMESTSDLLDLKESLVNKTRDAETTLLQQSRIHSELQAGLMRTRMVPFSKMVPRIRKGVRKTAADLNKSVQVTVKNGEVEIDRTILERMIPALEHMLRNAV